MTHIVDVVLVIFVIDKIQRKEAFLIDWLIGLLAIIIGYKFKRLQSADAFQRYWFDSVKFIRSCKKFIIREIENS